MVQVFEYALVILASTLIGGFSLYALGNYTSHVRMVEEASGFQSILSAISASIRTGAAERVVVFFDDETISCEEGRLSIDVPGGGFFSNIGAGCNFSFKHLIGTHGLVFQTVSGNLTLELRS